MMLGRLSNYQVVAHRSGKNKTNLVELTQPDRFELGQNIDLPMKCAITYLTHVLVEMKIQTIEIKHSQTLNIWSLNLISHFSNTWRVFTTAEWNGIFSRQSSVAFCDMSRQFLSFHSVRFSFKPFSPLFFIFFFIKF